MKVQNLFISVALLAVIPGLAHAQSAPIQIKNCQDLQSIKNNLSGNYALANDIDCSNFAFVPLGSFTNPFSGTLTGASNNGQIVYKIENLTIINSSTGYSALFGYIGGASPNNLASIHDLVLTNVNIQGGIDVATLANYTSGNTLINNISIDGVIGSFSASSLANTISGVITGTNISDLIENTSVNIRTVGDASNGISGFMYQNFGTIHQCSAHLNISTQNSASGFVLENAAAGTISNSYATGSITAIGAGDGFVGVNAGTISNSYAAVQMSPIGSLTAGFIGTQSKSGNTTNSYWDSQLSGVTKSAAGIGQTTAKMFQNSSYAGWDFTNSWSQYPQIRTTAIIPLVLPNITTQPANMEVNSLATATFTVVATGTPPVTYQWLENTSGLVGSGKWTIISGATSPSYTLTANSAINNGFQFECVVSNAAGSVTSDAVRLSIIPVQVIPIITKQPSNQTVTAPASATFTVVAVNPPGNPSPTYQWEVSTNNGASFAKISGATNGSYTIPSTTIALNGNLYFCEVFSATSVGVTNVVKLTVLKGEAKFVNSFTDS